ncbi:MAG: hypothetical protein JSS76_01480 [Bacteroidetes bacterium]|nr:hypothetical protein [Bacteroidota bacterium]
MKNIQLFIILLMLSAAIGASAQTKFEKVKSLKDIKATVKVLNEKQTVIVPDTEPTQRYVATELPEELRKDGLHLSIDGDVGAIPPNVRMIGVPFHITCIKVTSAEKKKYKLSKKKWCMR